MIGTILVIILILLLVGALPSWGYHSYGWHAPGLLGVVLIVVVILVLTEQAVITPLDAAKLILADYDGTLAAAARLDIDGCQSAIVSHGGETVLVIRGSDERQDWISNFRFLPDAAPGDSVWWHRGFLTYGRIAYSWARDKQVTVVIGHSLGAACVQIVATSLNIPGIAFASPRPLWAPFGKARPTNESLVMNYNRVDDAICDLPFALLGFEHVGAVQLLTPKERRLGEDHRITHYLDLLDISEAAST